MTENIFRGSCFCGAVRFEITPPTKWCAHCHCSMCRRAHGAAFVTWVGVASDHFRLTAGEATLGHYQSSDEAKRGFCSRCGSTLFFESKRWADEVHVVLANIEGPIDRAPQAHVYFDAKVEWCTINDDLKCVGEP